MCRKNMVVLLALFALVGSGLMMAACGGDGPGGPSPVTVSPAAPTSSGGTAAAPTPVNTTPANGIGVELISSTFDPERCTQLRDEKGNLTQYGQLSELVEVARITNNTALGVYPKPAIFHTKEPTCGAHADNPGGTTGLVTGANVDPGKSELWTHRFPVDLNACGSYQFDNDAKNGEISRSSLGGGAGGKVINTGIACPDCSKTNVQVAISGEGLTRTVKVTFQGEKPGKKATVSYGDGSSDQFSNGESKSHTWPYGSYTVSASLNVDGLDVPCTGTAVVNNEKPCAVEWKELEPEITYGEWGECKPVSNGETSANNGSSCSQSRSVRTVIKEQNSCTQEIRVKSDRTTTESRECKCPCVEEWIEQEPEITYGEWGECTRNESSASDFNADTQSSCSQKRTKRTVIREQNSCTQEMRVKSDTTTEESRSCECTSACDTSPATSSAAQGFELANSGEATEEAWVNDNVDPGPYELIRKDEFDDDGSCLTAAGPAKVVLVKAGKKYQYYLNVTTGQQLCSFDGKDISHISYFNCEEDD